MKAIFILLFSSLLFSIHQCGHIYSQPSDIRPQNSLSAKEFHFFFMLETPLAAADNLFIKFPFSVGSASVSVSSDMDVLSTTGYIETNARGLNGASTSTVDNRFFELKSALSANTWYRARVIIGDASNQKVGVAGCVWFATTSTFLNNYITYDENRCFDVISFAPEIDVTGTKFSVVGYYQYSATANYYKVPGASYTVNFDVTPSQTLDSNGGQFKMTLPGDFTFSGSCSSVACTSNDGNAGDYCRAENITALSASAYSCAVTGASLVFKVATAITYPINPIRIQATVVAPMKIVLSHTSFLATFESNKAYIIFARSTVTVGSVNGINLVTDITPQNTITVINTLMWGVTPSAATGARTSSYIGCPIVVYASQSLKVYNSLTTKFTPTAAMKAFSTQGNIQAVWTLISSGTVDSVIHGSFYSTLPGTLSMSFSSNAITITGITDLSIAQYTLAIKFSVAVTDATNGAILSTLTSAPSAPTFGAITLSVGSVSSKIYANIAGTPIAVKKNFEYKGAALTAGSLAGVNQVYAYWYSDTTPYDLASTTAATVAGVIKNHFLGQTTSKSATTGVWPKGSSTKTQAVMLSIYYPITAICPASAVTYSVGSLGSDCNTGTTAKSSMIALMLKVVFNNNVLAISDSKFFYGVKVNSLWDGATAGASGHYIDYSTSATLAGYNSIAKDSSGFWHATVVCKPETGGTSTAVDTCFTTTVYADGLTPWGSISFIDTNVAKYPSMYPDSYVLDFIICFKITPYAQVTLSTSVALSPVEDTTTSGSLWQTLEGGCETVSASGCTTTAGPQLINSYVISGMVDPATVKTSVVMGYAGGSTTINNYIPAYLRLGCTITSPAGSGGLVGFFIGASMSAGLSAFANSANSINVVDTVGTVGTATYQKGASSSYVDSTRDLWWAHDCLLFTTSVSSSAATFSYYVPIQLVSGVTSLKSIHLAVLGTKSNSVYPVSAVYRIFGSVFSNTVISSSPSYTTTGFSIFYSIGSAATNLGSGVFSSSGATFSISSSAKLWDNGMYATGTPATGCFGASQSATSPKIYEGTSSIFKPSKAMTGFGITSDVAVVTGTTTLCNLPTAAISDLTGSSSGDVQVSSAGTAFIVYIRAASNILAGATLTWGYSNTNANKCAYHTILSPAAGGSNLYTIFCQADGIGSTTTGTGSRRLAFSAFTTPFYWGLNYPLYNELHYGWSGKDGLWAAYNGDATATGTGAPNYAYYESGCTANDILTIAPTSKDVPVTLNLVGSNGVSYVVQPGKSLTLTYSNGIPSSSFYTVCTHATLSSCSVSGNVFTLTNPSGSTSAVTLSGTIAINAWADTDVTGSAQSYYVYITYDSASNYIEKCSSSATGGFQVSGSALSNVVTISSISFVNSQATRGVWSFTFAYSRIIRSSYDFSLNVGALAAPTRDNNNYRCMILSGTSVSNKWSTITPIDSSYATVVTTKTEYSSGGSFTYQCVGGSSPDGTLDSATYKVTGTVERSPGGTKVTAATIPDVNQYSVTLPKTSPATISSISMTKFFNTRGFESDYVFSFIPATTTITTSGRIIVEFSQSIPPKLNRYGIVECYLNETPVFCEFSSEKSCDERRVVVWPSMTLLPAANITYQYKLRITGVTQPNGFASTTIDNDASKKVFFGLSTTSSSYSGVAEMAYLEDSWDPSSSSESIASLLIHDFNIGSSKFRSTTTFTYVINFPANAFTNEAIVWVQFPGTLGRSFLYGTSPSFTFVRVSDSTNTNLVKRITMVRGRKVAVLMKADSANTQSCNYTLSIAGVSTPMETTDFKDDFRIFLSADNITVTASTASGARNSSKYIDWNGGSYAENRILNWYDATMNLIDNPVPVTIGTYQALVFLSAKMSTFASTWTFSPASGNTSTFVTQPRDPAYPVRATVGSQAAPVYIAAKTGSAPGLYYLGWTGQDATYSPIPNLDINVVSSSCTPMLPVTSFKVPFGGGISDPIIIDFSRCIPATDVTVMANITVGYSTTAATGITFSGTQTATESLTFSNMNGIYRVAFYATSNTGLTGTATSGVATIAFTMSGTNGANINSPGTVTIDLVDASTVAPVAMTPSVSNSILSVGCDQAGTNFFAFATNTNAAKYNQTYITSKTQAIKVSLTKPDSDFDPTYTVFGYISGLTASAYSTVNIAGYVKAGANMTVYSYCYSNSLLSSATGASSSWVQQDNSGVTYSLKGFFKSPVSSSQKLALACSLVKALQVPSRSVLNDEGKWCTSLRFLQNTTNTTNSSTTNTSTTNTSNASTTYSSYWFVLKNYLATTDGTSASLTTLVASNTFLSSLITATGDSSFPTPASPLFNVIAVNSSLSGGSTITPVVNYVSHVTNANSINVTFSLTNMNGIVFAGVELATGNGSQPNASALILGVNAAGSALTAINRTEITSGSSGTVCLTGLNASVQYTMYFVANNFDISINGLFSEVQAKNITSGAVEGSSFGNLIRISMMVLALAFLALFGLA